MATSQVSDRWRVEAVGRAIELMPRLIEAVLQIVEARGPLADTDIARRIGCDPRDCNLRFCLRHPRIAASIYRYRAVTSAKHVAWVQKRWGNIIIGLPRTDEPGQEQPPLMPPVLLAPRKLIPYAGASR
jgi:hypothetical protein